MAIAKMTVQDAPRNFDEMLAKGRFHRFNLAKEMGMLEEEDQKASWQSANDKEQTQQLLDALKAYDAQHGGSRQQTADPAPAEAPRAATVKRTPKNGGEDAPKPSSGGVVDDRLLREVLENQKVLNGKLDTLLAEVAATKRLSLAAVSAGMLGTETTTGATPNDLFEAVFDGDRMKDIFAAVIPPEGKGAKRG